MIEKAEQYTTEEKPIVEREPNRDFEKFKRERIFKKKLVSYTIEKVQKPSELLSLKVKTEQSN